LVFGAVEEKLTWLSQQGEKDSNFLNEKNYTHRSRIMLEPNKIIFGELNVPNANEIDESAQFTSKDFSEISEDINIRMYPTDMHTKTHAEFSTRTIVLELSGWEVKSI
jgi:hypothetical protein